MFYDQRKLKQLVKFMIIWRLECAFGDNITLFSANMVELKQNIEAIGDNERDLPFTYLVKRVNMG